MCRWDRDQSKLFGLHVEGGDESEEGDIRKKDTIIEGHLRICRKKKDYRTENCNYNQV